MRQQVTFEACQDARAVISQGDRDKPGYAKDWIPMLQQNMPNSALLRSLSGGIDFYDQTAQMFLAVFVEELLRGRGLLLNIPSWLSVYTKGAALKKQELVLDLFKSGHGAECTLDRCGMYELLLAWLPYQVARLGYTAWVGPRHRVPDLFWNAKPSQRAKRQRSAEHNPQRKHRNRLFKCSGPRFYTF